LSMTMNPAEESWFASPCFSCPDSPCCNTLPVYRPVIETRSDLDYALRLLDYRGIELGLYDSGKWMVYLTSPCRFLDRYSSKCMIHNAPEQPRLCAEYSPHQCWCRSVYARGGSRNFLRFNRERLERILTLVTYHPSGEIDGVPDWEQMIGAVAPIPIDSKRTDACPGVEPVTGPGAPGRLIDPCRGLLFPMVLPKSRPDLDLLRFRLGFPGVESALIEGMGVILIRTTCGHLHGNRCLMGRGLDCAAPFQRNHPAVASGSTGMFRQRRHKSRRQGKGPGVRLSFSVFSPERLL